MITNSAETTRHPTIGFDLKAPIINDTHTPITPITNRNTIN